MFYWTWFVSKPFGLPGVSFPVAVGLFLLGVMITGRGGDPFEDENGVKMSDFVWTSIGRPAMYLAAGWLISMIVI